MEIFPLNEVEPGMRGETWTVLSGREVVRLETEIIGIAEDNLAPGKHLIIGRLVDERVAVSGPVHGMSGSPLYVQGRLVGALSRRLGLFEKDGQCGFTPVEDMLELWEDSAVGAAVNGGALPKKAVNFVRRERILYGEMKSTGDFSVGSGEPGWLMLPVASGLREGWWLDFGRRLWQGTGLLLQAGGGGPGFNGAEAPGAPLEPGAPVAAALAVGDMILAATGTLTWREGDRILAFGHPFMDLGSVCLPMCEAEVVTVVPSYMTPYKLANIRREVGTTVLDRLSAVSGVIGRKAELPGYEISVSFNGRESRWRGRFFGHRRLAPSLLATLVLRAISSREDLPREVFFQYRGRVVFHSTASDHQADEFVLRLDGAGSGESEAWMNELMAMMMRLQAVTGQNFLEIRPVSFEWSVDVAEGEKVLTVSSIEVRPARLVSGERATVRVMLDDGRGGKVLREEVFMVPSYVSPESFLNFRVLSARALDMERVGLKEFGVGGVVFAASASADRSRAEPRSIEEVFSRQNRIGRSDELAVVVTRSGFAVRRGIEVLDGLPRSEAALLGADARVDFVQDSIVFEKRTSLDAVITGEQTVRVPVVDRAGWFDNNAEVSR